MRGEKDRLLFVSSQFYILARQVDTLKLAIDRIYTTYISKDNKQITSLVFSRTGSYTWASKPLLFPSLKYLKLPEEDSVPYLSSTAAGDSLMWQTGQEKLRITNFKHACSITISFTTLLWFNTFSEVLTTMSTL